MRRGSALVAAAAALLALGVAAGRGSGFTTTDASTTTAPTTTATASTATVTTTTTTTSTAATTTTTTATLAAQPLAAACAGSGLLAIVPPQGAPSLVGPAADAQQPAELASSAGDPILDVVGASSDAPTCNGSRPRLASTSVGSLSLFGGALAVDGIDVALVPAPGGWTVTRTLGVVTIGGTPVPPTAPAAQRRLGDWGVVSLPASAPGAAEAGGAWLAGALVVSLTKAHAGLAAGTTLYVGYVEAATPPQPLPAPRAKRQPRVATRAAAPPHRAHKRRHHKRKKRISRPLTVTPALHGGPYVFPVVGEVDWGDSYGGPRSDVSGGWHHGDDLFAPLGRPVVAAADGTVYLVGWEKLGGWRLWLKDRADDRFYYAHMSGYTALARNGQKVKAGQVLGFVGNTGDAFTTPDHLHFEIHPVSLLPLRYDGAVDPTTYLRGWRHETPASVPLPRALPPGASTHGDGAVTDYRKLLSARGIAPRPAKASRPATTPPEPRPFPEQRLVALPRTPAAVARGGGTSPLPLVLAPLVAIALTSLLLFREPIRSRLRKARS